VDDITRLVVEKLLLTPTEQLKTLHDAETIGLYSEALTRLFGLTSLQAQGADSPSQKSESASDAEQRSDRGDRRVEPFVRPQKR
jgi:hypothetical protein